MKYLFVLLIALFGTTAYAADTEWDIYAFTDYNPIRIMYVAPGANVDLEASKAGLAGAKKKIKKTDIPSNESGRDFWKMDKGSIVVDSVSKSKHDQEIEKKSSDRASAIQKLKATGLTDDELLALNIRQEVV